MADQTSRNALQPGNMLHWYRIEKILGQGGFGITYLATDTNLDHKVAIKEYLPLEFAVRDGTNSVYPASTSHDERYKWGLDRFVAEARTLAKFKHRSIVQVLSVFEANNTAYMVMEYERGKSLQELYDVRKTLSEEELTRLVKPLLSGLAVIHAEGFIHRDIKPANIFVRQKGPPVLLDFGSARQAMGTRTRTLTAIVSPGYAPFEQYYTKSDRQGPWTDIYSLAATVYRGVAGRPPLDAVDRSEALLKAERDIFVSAQEIGRGRYSERFLAAIDAGLKFREKDRPQTIEAWRELFDFSATKPSPVASVPTRAPADRTFVVPEPTATAPTPVRLDPGERSAPSRVRTAPPARRRWVGAMVVILAGFGGAIGYLEWRAAPAWTDWRNSVVAAITGPDRSHQESLHAAQTALGAGRLLGAGSAFTLYESILASEPTHAEARAGMTTLGHALVREAESALARSDFAAVDAHLAAVGTVLPYADAQAALENAAGAVTAKLATARQADERLEQARSAARAGLAAVGAGPGGSPGLDYAALRQTLDAYGSDPQVRAEIEALPARLEAPVRAAIAGGEIERAAPMLEILQAFAAEHPLTRELSAAYTEAQAAGERVAGIDQRLQRAAAALKALQLTGPGHDNALSHYRAVLQVDPANAAAQQGIDRIVSAYLGLAAEAHAEDDVEQARIYLDRAAKARADDPRITRARRLLRVAEARAVRDRQRPVDPRTQEERRRAFENDLLRLGR